MSSLKSQLVEVATSNATVALDRKRRQKLHSASLIYNPKTASTQDYEFIFENAVDALKDLIEIDPHFEIFTRSLFSESSISIDKNVQSKEEAKNLDNAINGYLMLASSKWHLTPTLHATEWLVRRFQIHICNAETFLLSTINYYQTPIFKRILSIIKLPPLFSPLSSFVRSERNPSNVTIIKLFNDMGFLRLYANYLSKCTEKRTTYTNQMLFTSCCFINLIAFNSNDEEKLNNLVPIFLEMAAKLLASKSVDCQIAAHCILVVLATALPLKKVIILAATETILSNLESTKAKTSALVTICKLWQTLRGTGNVDQLPAPLYELLESRMGLGYIIDYLKKADQASCDKFVTSYIRAIARYDHQKLNEIVKILKETQLEKFEERLILVDLIHLSEVLEDKSQLIALFEYFVSINETLVLKCINSLNISRELFEIKLTTSLFKVNEEISESDVMKALSAEKESNGQTRTLSFKEFLEKHSSYINTSNRSMLAERDEFFGKLLSLFLEAVGRTFPPGLFLSSFFTTMESRITFLIRVLVSPAAPVALKSIALSNISKYINSIDKESNVFTLVPTLVCALNDVSKNVRMGVKRVLTQILKRPFTKHYFMSNKLYGENKEIPMLSPKDGEFWLSHFLNEYLVENYEVSSLIIPKKNDKVYLLFWSNQALFMPLPATKTILFKYLNGNLTSGSGANKKIFEELISSYLQHRDEWEDRCRNNKTDFSDFETSLVDLISLKEKNDFMIEFIINALKSDYESLANVVADKLQSIFGSLKFNQQLKITQTILESAAAADSVYDAVGTLQSLPLDTNIFVSILSQNRIHTDSELSELPKRRRRRSSANKAALQKEEVSQIAEAHLRKLTIILEALDNAKVTGSEPLLSNLLSLVSDLETLEKDGGLPVLYAQETLASCMLNTINSLGSDSTPKPKNVRADVIVSAIRNSNSPQVQNKLLLVIGALANLDSETVLHSVMPIFTFMGAHSIRQDDEFTNQVVENTIQTIVPALLKNSTNVTDEVEFLLMSFTTALQHVPKHRRVKLYSTLVRSLGPSRAIAPFLFLISQQYSADIKSFKISEARSLVEFTKSLMTNFDVTEQLKGLRDYLSLLRLLINANENEEEKEVLKLRAPFTSGILNFPHAEFLGFLQNALTFADKAIEETEVGYYDQSWSFKVKVYSALLDTRNDASVVEEVRSKFGSFLETLLAFINQVSKQRLNQKSEGDGLLVEAEFTEKEGDIKKTLFSLLSHLLNVLPVKDFVDAVLPLLANNADEDIRYHLTLVIGAKFAEEGPDATPAAEQVISMLLDRVSKEKDFVNNVQVSLNTLGSLVTNFGSHLQKPLVVDVLRLATETLGSAKSEIVISSLAAVTSCVQALGVKSIAFYPKIVPPALKIFQDMLGDEENTLKEQLQLAILLLFAALIKKLPSFVVSNLGDVLKVVLFSGFVNVSTRLSIISLLVENMDLREVLKVLYKLWGDSVSTISDSIAISLFLSALQSTVEAIDKKSATSQSPIFFKLLLTLFEYRSISEFDENTINRIESSVYQIANSYVLKLNDKVFRPLFVILVRWAFDGEGVTNSKMTEVERLTSFFKFFNKLQENLKVIITSYFTYLLEPVSDLLRKFVDRKIVNVNLRRVVLNSLTSSFKYDRDEYWKSTSRFELICEPLVDQLSNVEGVIGKYLVKAIASLAANNNRVDEHNKFMHKLLVKHMRATCSSNEKLWAVRTLKMIYSKVGESWLVLLPQLVPTIVELLEDEDEEVEHEVRSGLVKVVENVLGEPFDRYLD